MNFEKELEIMRSNYAERPLKHETLPRPYWLTPSDELFSIYNDKSCLFEYGQVFYAYIVQANVVLFRFFPHSDCPANIVFSEESVFDKRPMLLKRIAKYLFHFKSRSDQHLNEEYKDILRVIRDEHDRSSFKFRPFLSDELGEEMTFASIMVFRKHLPRRVIKSGLVPVLAAPGHCNSVMILPKKYWTKSFKSAWVTDFNNIQEETLP